MPRRSSPGVIKEHLQQLKDFLADFEKELERDDLRPKVLSLIPVYHELRDLGSSLIPSDVAQSGRERILSYLKKYPKKIINGEELMVVAGINDYPRRIRELRKEFGWNILSGNTVRDMLNEGDILPLFADDNLFTMKTDDYILMSLDQDRDAAYRWKLANTIRNKKASVKDKILEYFKANIGKPVTGEELRYLAKDRSEWARRVRQLRTEEGWPIITNQTGDPDLPVGVYVLEENRQMHVHDRKIPDEVRVEVLTRDNFQCTNPKCGWNRSMRRKEDPRQFLELHHIVHHVNLGANVAGNLITLCNVCHDRVHAGGLKIEWVEIEKK